MMFFAWIALSYRCEYQQKNIIFNMDPSTVEELIISLATRVAKHYYLLLIITIIATYTKTDLK